MVKGKKRVKRKLFIIFAVFVWTFAIVMIYKYAPADTEDVPVVSKKERRKRKNISYVILTVMISSGVLVSNSIVSNILLVGALLQTLSITRVAYRLTNNKYGHEVYLKSNNVVVN